MLVNMSNDTGFLHGMWQMKLKATRVVMEKYPEEWKAIVDADERLHPDNNLWDYFYPLFIPTVNVCGSTDSKICVEIRGQQFLITVAEYKKANSYT